jgi:hypothetical protein
MLGLRNGLAIARAVQRAEARGCTLERAPRSETGQ